MSSSFILKICAAYSAVQGRSSCFIETRGKAGTGKSYEDELVLSCFDESDIIHVADVTYASLFDFAEAELNKKIVMLGDLGNKHFCKLENVFSVFKVLMTEHKYKRKIFNKEQSLCTDSLCVIYETTKKMTHDEQIVSRSLQFTTHQTQDDLLELFIQKQNKSEEQELVAKYRAEIQKKRQLNIHVKHDFIQLFADEVRKSHVSNKIRKLEQILNLFESYCILESDVNCSCEIEATQEDYDSFMQLVRDCHFCEEAVVQDFLEMLQGSKLESVDLTELVESEFSNSLKDDEKRIVSVLYRRYGLNGRSRLFQGRHVFFSVHSLRKEFNSRTAFENVDDLHALLGFLVNYGVVGVLGSFRATKIYYLRR